MMTAITYLLLPPILAGLLVPVTMATRSTRCREEAPLRHIEFGHYADSVT